jgi:uncharacterized protein (TIGR03435 family)
VILDYTPDAVRLMSDQAAARAAFPHVDPAGPALSTALQEQLGINLEHTRGPVDVIVIDSVDHPLHD